MCTTMPSPPPPMFCFVFKKEFFQNSCFMCMGVLYAYLGKPEEGTRPSRIKVRDYCEPLWVLGSGLRSSGRAAFPAEPSPQPRPHLRKSLNVYICWEQTCQTLWVRGQLWGVPPPCVRGGCGSLSLSAAAKLHTESPTAETGMPQRKSDL